MRKLQGHYNLKSILSRVDKDPALWLARLVFFLAPAVCFLFVEILNENDIFHDLQPWQIGMNLIWYACAFIALRLLLGRSGAAAGAVIFYGIGMLNHYILRFRGRILFPADVSGWRTAANVAEGFDYSRDWYIVQASVLLVAYLFAVFCCAKNAKRRKIPLVIAAALWLVMGGYCYAFFGTQMLPNLNIYTQQWVTQRNGFLLNFTVALRYSSVDKPSGYSKQMVEELMQQYPAVPADKSRVVPENIVVIMNESFADFTLFDGFEASEDPTPFLHSLSENTIKGWMYSPVTGGGTASVEFEYLTGFSTIFQPPHTVAYQLYVSQNMPSLAALAGDKGYATTAFHPYKASGWNRELAYDYLSFATQLYEQDVENPYYIRQYISDISDYEMIFDLTRENQRNFVFNVTMQNHSGYAQGWNNLQRSIQLSENLRSADSSAQQYFALARASDEALQHLLAYYSALHEPTMVVFFGDHQPPLKNKFYEQLYGKPLSQRTTAEVLQQYAVPFFIWTNYDMSAQEDVIISPNFLGVLTAKLAGLPLTGYMNFLDQLYEQMPVITPVGIIDADGQAKKRQELDETQRQLLHGYEILNYCGMIDLFDGAGAMFRP